MEAGWQEWVAWDVDQVCEWLNGIDGLGASGKEACIASFRAHRVTGAALALLDVSSEGSGGAQQPGPLKTELGITALGDRLILCSQILALRSARQASRSTSRSGSCLSPTLGDYRSSAGPSSPWLEQDGFDVASPWAREHGIFHVEIVGEGAIGLRWTQRSSEDECGPLAVAEVLRGGLAETLADHEIRYVELTPYSSSQLQLHIY